MLEVQGKFIKDVQEKGIEYVLEWIDSYYREVAEAHVHDEISRCLPERAFGYSLQVFMSKACNPPNSTSNGSNLLQRALMAAWAKKLKNDPKYMLIDRLAEIADKTQLREYIESAESDFSKEANSPRM